MTVPRVLVATVVSTGLLTAALPAQQPPARFRSNVDAVSVPVSVKEKNRAIAGLTGADFELLDNGVPQTISTTSVEALAADVTLVLDASGSVKGPALAKFKADIQQIVDLLGVNDRVRLVTFGTTATDALGLQPGGATLPLDRIEAFGATAFYSALSAVLIAYPFTERPHLIFAFSDGLDNLSFVEASHVVSLSGYSGASLYVMLTPGPVLARLRVLAPYVGGPNKKALTEAAARTGGVLYESPSGAALPTVFRQALDDFRMSYVLTYTPAGVPRTGWHEIAVRVKNPRYTVRARTGYDAG